MKITKYEHACFTVEIDGRLLVVDPGAFTTDLPALESVEAIVVTHDHPDHFDVTALGAIIAHNPDATIYAHSSIVSQLGDTLPHQSITSGERVEAGPFKLDFIGDTHAVIHPDMPTVANLGVFINDRLYYPGDSFSKPNRSVDILALPVAAPWLKIQEAVDFARQIAPRFIFPTHDAILSASGKSLPDRMIPGLIPSVEYRRIDGETIER